MPPDRTDMRLHDLKDRIARERYAVDPRAVADALLRTAEGRALLALPPVRPRFTRPPA